MLKCLKALRERPEKQLNQVENMKKSLLTMQYIFSIDSQQFFICKNAPLQGPFTKTNFDNDH